MKEQEFTLELENKIFQVEIDKDGLVWIIENNEKLQTPEGTNVGQRKSVTNLEEAKELGKIMLYASGRIKTI
jgi:hypothetical protein